MDERRDVERWHDLRLGILTDAVLPGSRRDRRGESARPRMVSDSSERVDAAAPRRSGSMGRHERRPRASNTRPPGNQPPQKQGAPVAQRA